MITDLPIERALVERSVSRFGYDVHIVSERRPGQVGVVLPLKPLVIQTILDGESFERTPAFCLSEASAQNLLNALWEAGVRPSTGGNNATGMAAVIEAQKEHINDLRHMAGIVKSKDQPTSGSPLF